MMKFYPKFKIRIVYKSGYTHDFWAWSFNIKFGGDKEIQWHCVDDSNKPILIGVADIAAVYQVGFRQVFRFTDPLK